jgi:uncharacterized lipoprotein YehR (DUF1307 family)
MKNQIIIIVAISGLLCTQCNKTTENKEVISSQTYRGTDGTRAKVTFTDNSDRSYITIESNNKKVEILKKSPDLYENESMKALVKGDSVIVTQGKNVIQLVKDK